MHKIKFRNCDFIYFKVYISTNDSYAQMDAKYENNGRFEINKEGSVEANEHINWNKMGEALEKLREASSYVEQED